MSKPLDHALRERSLTAQLSTLQDAHQAEREAHQAEVASIHRNYAQQLYALQLLLEKYQAQQRLDRARRFGASAEKGDHQACLFDEAENTELVASADAPPDVPTIEVAAHTKKKPCRAPLAASLPRVIVDHPLPSLTCTCGGELTVLAPTISEQIDVIPAQVFVLQHQRQRGVCRMCDTAPVTAPLPPQPFPKSLASPGLLAFVGVNKFVDGMPLYRLSEAFARQHIHLPRQTLAGHVIAAGELVTPLINVMSDDLLAHDVLAIDETRVQVLKEPHRPAQRQSTMWVMRGGSPTHPVVRFEYDISRGKAVVDRLLAGYRGYLQRDGYAGYREVCARPEIIGVGCWAHVRRKFVDAMKALPAKEQSKGNRTQQAMAFITALYAIERRMADKPPDERRATRQRDALPLLARFKAWLEGEGAGVTNETLLGKAIRYTLSEWPHLTTYCLDGRLRIDNNLVENAIRPFAVGRKNWLFSDTQKGAVASANLYSLVETARANGLNPYAYLKLVFTALPKATTVDDIEALLPWNVDQAVLDDMMRVPTFSKELVVG